MSPLAKFKMYKLFEQFKNFYTKLGMPFNSFWM